MFEESISVQEIVNMLKRDKRKPVDKQMPGWRRLRLALVGILEGILIFGTQPVKVSLEVVDMVRNLKSFLAYPWGHESFELTLRMIKVGSKVESLADLLDKFLQSHALCHGFPLALQLVVFHAVPLLEQYQPNGDEEKFADCQLTQLPKLKSYHNTNILQTKYDPAVRIQFIIQTDEAIHESVFTWPSDTHDLNVDYLMRLVHEGHQFSINQWQGGYSGCALLTPPPPKKGVHRLRPCTGKGRMLKEEDDDDRLQQIEVINHSHTMEVKRMWEAQQAKLKEELKMEILQELCVWERDEVASVQMSPEKEDDKSVTRSFLVDDTLIPVDISDHDSKDTTMENSDKISSMKNYAPKRTMDKSDEFSPTAQVAGVIHDLKESGSLTKDADPTAEKEDESTDSPQEGNGTM